MKIVVLAKHVPDTETTVKIHADQKSLDESHYKYIINPCDEYAVEEAIRTQEKFSGSESVIVSLGLANTQDTIRKALAMGIDRGVWINTEGYSREQLDSDLIASAIATVVKEEKPDIIFAGLNTTDEGSANVGIMVSELVGCGSLMNVRKIDWSADGQTLKAERDAEGGIVEVYEATLPVLIAPHQNLNEPRFASLPGIMKAKRKTITEKKFSELVTNSTPKVRVEQYQMPPAKSPGKILRGQPVEDMVKTVVQLLRQEAKVI
jgi:electron transfer flavoprotein beta subunit